MPDFSKLPLSALIAPQGHACSCGRHHAAPVEFLCIESGAVRRLPEALSRLGVRRPFIVCDPRSKAAAWEPVRRVLEEAGIAGCLFCFPEGPLEPDERAAGSLMLAFDPSCDCVLGIGSGVINDCCKMLAHVSGRKQLIVATAPSMDGYASNSSAMIRDRVKVTIYNAPPAAILCDTDILRSAPMRMLQAGLGDMLAKCVSICEWRISHLVTGEYYCEHVAAMMREALRRVVAHAEGLKNREEASVRAVVEGLVISGIASSYAGMSRPASGLEHCFSHMWEMMCLDAGRPFDLHGIQVGIGTLIVLKLYDRIRAITPDRTVAEAFFAHFSNEDWEALIRRIFGRAADAVIQQEHRVDHKNDPDGHAARLDRLISHWDEILVIIDEELPPAAFVADLMRKLEMPMKPEDIQITRQETEDAFLGSREIRARYMTSSMLWDLGLLYQIPLPE